MVKSRLTVRSAVPSDVSQITRLIRLGVKERDLLPRDSSTVWRLLPCCFVAADGEKIVGCAFAQVFATVYQGRIIDQDGRWCEVRSLLVLPEYRQRGIGTRLVSSCVRFAKRQGVHIVMAVTRKPGVFEPLGFSQKLHKGQVVVHLYL